MTTSDSIGLLKQNGLRKTASRISILDLFLANGAALSEADLEVQLKGLCDRATIYRTLKTFEEEGLLHRVLDEDNAIKYALCKTNDCYGGHHHHDHIHFKCDDCGSTICLDDVPIQPVSLPKGFRAKESNVLVTGTCEKCNQ